MAKKNSRPSIISTATAIILVALLFYNCNESSSVSSAITGGLFANTERDSVQLESLMNGYYDALRAENYTLAATYYETGAFDDFPTKPEVALKLASEMTGIPDSISLEGIVINDGTARAEVIIQRKGMSPVYYEATDENGTLLGTWAVTLNFVKQSDGWKISKGSTQSVDEMNTAQMDVLQSLLKH